MESRRHRGLARPGDDAKEASIAEQLRGLRFPAGFEHIYEYFCRLSAARGSNGFGPNPLSPIEIDTWCRLSGNRLTAWEYEIIEELDRRWLGVYAKLHKPDEKVKEPQRGGTTINVR